MYYLLVPIIYLGFVYIINKNKSYLQRYNYDNFKTNYNYIMIFISFTNIILSLLSNYRDNKIYIHDLICKPYDIDNVYMRYNVLLFLFSKIFEWCDTFFLIMYNKPLIFLHLFHHSSTFLLTYLNSYPISAIYFLPCFLNSFVHFIMYSYYQFKFMRPFKFIITKMQILQHFLVLLSTIYLLIQNYYNIYCFNNMTSIYIGIFCYFAYFILFISFYLKNKHFS
jgi:fatty acid elongase 3